VPAGGRCVPRVCNAFAPAVLALAEFGADLHRHVSARLAAKGLTWEQVQHLPADELAAVVWGDDLPADSPVEVTT
jgi:hypothetical protein